MPTGTTGFSCTSAWRATTTRYVDEALELLSRSGHPVVRLDLDRSCTTWPPRSSDGSSPSRSLAPFIGVNPFDQPDVQAAKDMTNSVLSEFERSGSLPDAPETMPTAELLSLRFSPGDYVAIMAYAHQISRAGRRRRRPPPRRDDPLSAWQRRWATARASCTRLDSFTRAAPLRDCSCSSSTTLGDDLEIPGQPYSFGVLASAQALGRSPRTRGSGSQGVQNGPERRVRCRGQRPCP